MANSNEKLISLLKMKTPWLACPNDYLLNEGTQLLGIDQSNFSILGSYTLNEGTRGGGSSVVKAAYL